MNKILPSAFFIFILLSTQLFAQINIGDDLFEDDSTVTDCNHKSINLGYENYGISFGNSEYHSGIRLNFSDCGIKEINGINITLWEPKKNPGSVINGMAFGLAPLASRIYGINIGIAASITERSMYGINFGGLALVSGGDIYGINVGGLAAVAENEISGINIGGLALVSENNIKGVNIGGLAVVAEKEIWGVSFSSLALVSESGMKGINLSGLANVSEGSMMGINMAGLALVSEESIQGMNFGGLALVGEKGIRGINIGGAAVVAEDGNILGLSATLGKIFTYNDINGITVAGYKTEAENFHGINSAICWTELGTLQGISISGLNKINRQNGISIGLFNIAEILNGIQIGLINIADNNPVPFRILPFINMHID